MFHLQSLLMLVWVFMEVPCVFDTPLLDSRLCLMIFLAVCLFQSAEVFAKVSRPPSFFKVCLTEDLGPVHL